MEKKNRGMARSIKNKSYDFLKSIANSSQGRSSSIMKFLKLKVLQRRERHFKNLSMDDKRRELAAWYEKMTGEDLDLDHPKDFNQKIQWMKLYDNQEIKTRLSDKYAVREWVREQIGEKYLIPIYGVWEKGEDIHFEKLPNRFVLKANHGSGMNLIVKNKDQLNEKKTRKLVGQWMITPPDLSGFEQQYAEIPRKILAEEYIEQEDGNLLDYKIHCFGGQPKIIQVIGNRDLKDHQAKEAYFDTRWNRIQEMYNDYAQYDIPPEKPENLAEMLRAAEVLSQDFDYVRVDLYLVQGQIKFGEMTFTPAAGLGKWAKAVPDAWWKEM